MNSWWDGQIDAPDPSAHLPVPITRASTSRTTQPVLADEWAQWWHYARRCARGLAMGVEPPAIEVFGPVLADDEEAFLSATLSYGRLYGGDGHYRETSLFVASRPAVMVGALAVNAALNRRRRTIARSEAEVRWRDEQQVPVIATTLRLMWHTTDGWLAAYYGDVTEFYPDVSSWAVTLGFGTTRPPLRLTGPAAPAVAVIAAPSITGRRWLHDPRLAPLLRN